jgi:hypothetical protein
MDMEDLEMGDLVILVAQMTMGDLAILVAQMTMRQLPRPQHLLLRPPHLPSHSLVLSVPPLETKNAVMYVFQPTLGYGC